MSEILTDAAFAHLRLDYAEATYRCSTLYGTPEDDAAKALLGARLDAAYQALRASNAAMREALENIVEETTDETALTIARAALSRAAEGEGKK